jgi:hypothetical protein
VEIAVIILVVVVVILLGLSFVRDLGGRAERRWGRPLPWRRTNRGVAAAVALALIGFMLWLTTR